MVDADKAKQVATRSAIEVGAVGLGLAIAGPAGALIAGAIKPVVELVSIRERRGLRNAEILAEVAMEVTGLSAEEFTAWASARDDRTMLFTSAVQAAYSSMAKNKVDALSRVLRNTLGDDDKLDLAIVIVAALEDLEPAHVRVLSAMVNDDPVRLTSERFVDDAWPLSGLKVRFPSFAAGLAPIMAGLERHGIVNGGGLAATAPDGSSDPVWSVTEFGKICFEYLSGPMPA
ncbi:hypothetical protein ACN27J_11850 [Solwaraspora sp. WMMB762]|uniref:hypothetical protein n=1 Tax=Solwaraspora sp. WMMB762 TaxID=3404120 RepID=UPI003B95D25C